MLPPTSAAFTENVYKGKRVPPHNRAYVTVNGEPLALRLDLRDHSPDGFEWGYNGSGPTQLALAILAHEYGDEVALKYYITFRQRVVAELGERWAITSGFIGKMMAQIAQMDKKVWPE